MFFVTVYSGACSDVTEFPYMYISDSAYISAHVSYSDVNLTN